MSEFNNVIAKPNNFQVDVKKVVLLQPRSVGHAPVAPQSHSEMALSNTGIVTESPSNSAMLPVPVPVPSPRGRMSHSRTSHRSTLRHHSTARHRRTPPKFTYMDLVFTWQELVPMNSAPYPWMTMPTPVVDTATSPVLFVSPNTAVESQ